MSKRNKHMEHIAVREYAALIRELGDAAALEIVCGAFAAGQLREKFLRHVFGRQIRKTAVRLDSEHGRYTWLRKYPSLANGLAAVKAGI